MKKVTFIDSGIGGLSTLREFSKICYDCEIKYVADNANVPYGNKSKLKINALVCELFNRFVEYDDDVVCLACNTMSSCALTNVQEKYPIKVFGVTPNYFEPIENGKSKIMLLGTCRTIEENIDTYKKKGLIVKPQSDLAQIIERYIFDKALLREKIERIYEQSIQLDVDAVILGCTHYSLVRDIFKDVFSKYTTFYDNNSNVARDIARHLELNDSEKFGRNNKITIRLTDNNSLEVEKYMKILKNIV